MCRLFALHGGERVISATFWLLDAPVSLAAQSHTQPDGYGIGTFEEDGSPDVERGPVRALEDEMFAHEARQERSRTFVAHLRFASTGAPKLENTHPFEQHGRLFAHNGVLWGLPELEERLGEHRSLVQGDTDSERLFALITRETELRGGDLEAGIQAAIHWVADHLPVFSLNFVLATPTDLWALRYPETHNLFVCEREAGGEDYHGTAPTTTGSMHIQAPELAHCRSVVLATEPMDDDPGWRLLEPGELLHVPIDLCCTSTTTIDRPPARLLTLRDLDERAAASQTADTGAVAAARCP
jgi:predicted glutamine amidotransferase